MVPQDSPGYQSLWHKGAWGCLRLITLKPLVPEPYLESICP
jgi:hypothetical protein